MPIKVIIAVILVKTAVVLGVTYYFTPEYTVLATRRPSRWPSVTELHAGQLESDYRYCHLSTSTTVPSTPTCASANVCMTCHSMVRKDDPMLAPVR